MPRTRKHHTEEEQRQANARRQAELRARTVRVDRAAMAEFMHEIDQAAAAGDEMAQAVRTASPDALLRNLAHWLRSRRRPDAPG